MYTTAVSCCAASPDQRKQSVDALRPKRSRWLVEDEGGRRDRECFGQFDQLAVRDTNVLDADIDVDVASHPIEFLTRPAFVRHAPPVA